MPRPLSVLIPVVLLALCPMPRASAQGTTAWVKEQVTKLTNPDKIVRKAAREALVREATRTGSPATYLADLDAALIPLARGRDVRARITAGVVAEQVAGEKPSPALEGIAQALMEGSDATALLGTKVARALLPATITLSRDPLAAAVIACVKAHPDSGEIAEEAYAALTLQSARKNGAAPPAAMIAAAVPSVLNLLEVRIAAYGKDVPPKPSADSKAAAFLALDGWPVLSASAPTANRILRDVGDLVCVQSRAVGDGSTDRSLKVAQRQAAQSLQVIGGAPLKSMTDELIKPLDGVAPDDVDRRCAALNQAMPPAAKLTRAMR